MLLSHLKDKNDRNLPLKTVKTCPRVSHFYSLSENLTLGLSFNPLTSYYRIGVVDKFSHAKFQPFPTNISKQVWVTLLDTPYWYKISQNLLM